MIRRLTLTLLAVTVTLLLPACSSGNGCPRPDGVTKPELAVLNRRAPGAVFKYESRRDKSDCGRTIDNEPFEEYRQIQQNFFFPVPIPKSEFESWARTTFPSPGWKETGPTNSNQLGVLIQVTRTFPNGDTHVITIQGYDARPGPKERPEVVTLYKIIYDY